MKNSKSYVTDEIWIEKINKGGKAANGLKTLKTVLKLSSRSYLVCFAELMTFYIQRVIHEKSVK